MKGFFSVKELKSSSRVDGKVASCSTCGLYKSVLSPRMEPFGNFKKGILNIGEAPGEIEDRKGKQWQGKEGQILRQIYKKLGIDLFEDCLNFNAVNCRPVDTHGNTRTPTGQEIICCRRRVLEVIRKHKPKVIILFGQTAIQSVIGWRWNKQIGSVSTWRGFTIPDSEYKAWVCPVFHPSYVDRQPDAIEIQTIWKQDLERALSMIEQPLPFTDSQKDEDCIEYISIKDLDRIKFGPYIAIDYETTGLKPYAKGHRIVCASIAVNENEVKVFMLPEKRSEQEPLRRLLASKKVGKIAHNMKFEEMWSREYLGQPVINWVWDTMLAAHVLDNRPDITGLKFQTYIHFGQVGYDDEVSKYLRSKDDKNANEFNNIDALINTEAGRHELMKYCALDSLYTFRLARLQMAQLGKRWPEDEHEAD